jgi:hypothetical protein
VVVPDIGAFPERVTRRSLSAIVAWDKSPDEWAVFWRELLTTGELPQGTATAELLPASSARDDSFYEGSYLQAVPLREGRLTSETVDGLANNYYVMQAGLSRSERLLRGIWRLSRSPLVARCVALVPFGLKQSFKRRLSSRPMHDIVHKE